MKASRGAGLLGVMLSVTVALTVPQSASGVNLGSCGAPTLASQGRPVTASSVEDPSVPPADAVDGNPGTRWASASNDPQWLRVDLGAVTTICRVVLTWEVAFGSVYQIQTSLDGAGWTTIQSTTAGNGGIDDLTNLTGQGRYVRMLGTTRATQWGYSLWEFQVYAGSSGTGPCGGSAPLKPGGTPWQCTFSDEFSGSSLDRNIWSLIPYGLGSSCLFDDSEYVEVSGGTLRLMARRLPASHWCTVDWGLEYGGGGIQTQGRFGQQYGRFEIRATFPPGDGFWPAFWLLPNDDSYSGEIDVVESYGGRGNVGDATLHVPAAGPGPQNTCALNPDYFSGYHTYTMEWSQGTIRILYDNVVCANFTGLSSAFDQPYHILLDLAVQPWWPPNANTPFPGVMSVDYVRVWQ